MLIIESYENVPFFFYFFAYIAFICLFIENLESTKQYKEPEKKKHKTHNPATWGSPLLKVWHISLQSFFLNSSCNYITLHV